MRTFLQFLAHCAAPVLLLAAGFAAVYFGDTLAPALGRWALYGPYLALAGAAALALALNRGRAFFALVTLAAGYAVQQHWLAGGLAAPGARAVYAAIAVLVPLNMALLAWLPERGVFNRRGAICATVLLVETALCAWLFAGDSVALADWAWRRWLPFQPGFGALPQSGVIVVLVSIVATLAAAFALRPPFPAACAGAIVAFAVAAHVPTAAYTSSAFTLAAVLMIALALGNGTPRRRA